MMKTKRAEKRTIEMCVAIALVAVGCRTEAESNGSTPYEFQCTSQADQHVFEAVDHVFRVPDGFQVDKYNDNSLVLTVTNTLPGKAKTEVQSVIIRYGSIDEEFHKDWTVVSSRDQVGLGFSVKISTKEHVYGAQSHWVAFVDEDQEIVIYSMLPVDWQSFLGCLVS